MKNFKSTFASFEGCELKPFSEYELALVLGGDDPILNFPTEDYGSDNDDDDYFN